MDADERAALDELFRREEVRDLVRAHIGRGEDAAVRLIDAAYWMKGCSSLGFLRYAALVRIEEPNGKRSLALVDLKEAIEAAGRYATAEAA